MNILLSYYIGTLCFNFQTIDFQIFEIVQPVIILDDRELNVVYFILLNLFTAVSKKSLFFGRCKCQQQVLLLRPSLCSDWHLPNCTWCPSTTQRWYWTAWGMQWSLKTTWCTPQHPCRSTPPPSHLRLVNICFNLSSIGPTLIGFCRQNFANQKFSKSY